MQKIWFYKSLYKCVSLFLRLFLTFLHFRTLLCVSQRIVVKHFHMSGCNRRKSGKVWGVWKLLKTLIKEPKSGIPLKDHLLYNIAALLLSKIAYDNNNLSECLGWNPPHPTPPHHSLHLFSSNLFLAKGTHWWVKPDLSESPTLNKLLIHDTHFASSLKSWRLQPLCSAADQDGSP